MRFPSMRFPQLAEKFAAELAALDAGEARLIALTREVEAAEAAYASAARVLSEARKKAAAALDAAVSAELAPLKLEGARFMTEIRTEAEGPDGCDQVEFWVQTNPGTKPGPLMKIASGGELARFMLALKVVLADRGSAPTLVFDEIDTGAGGAVADAMGQRLARLASRVQVLAVTHAPQVAARARGHFRIAKDAADQGPPRRDAGLASRNGSAPRGNRPNARRRDDHRRGAGRCRAPVGERRVRRWQRFLVAAFEAAPRAGVISFEGEMLDVQGGLRFPTRHARPRAGHPTKGGRLDGRVKPGHDAMTISCGIDCECQGRREKGEWCRGWSERRKELSRDREDC